MNSKIRKIIIVILVILGLLLIGYSILNISPFITKGKGTKYSSDVEKIEFQGYKYTIPKKNTYELYTIGNRIIFYTTAENKSKWEAAISIVQIDELKDKTEYSEDDITAIKEYLSKEGKSVVESKIIQIEGVNYITCHYLNKEGNMYLFGYTMEDNSNIYEMRIFNSKNYYDYEALSVIAKFLKSRVKIK